MYFEHILGKRNPFYKKYQASYLRSLLDQLEGLSHQKRFACKLYQWVAYTEAINAELKFIVYPRIF
jgi:hypothetical protein